MTPIFMRIWLMNMRKGLRASDITCELAKCLAHQTGLDADVLVAHVAFDFSFGDEGSDGVDDDDVDGI